MNEEEIYYIIERCFHKIKIVYFSGDDENLHMVTSVKKMKGFKKRSIILFKVDNLFSSYFVDFLDIEKTLAVNGLVIRNNELESVGVNVIECI